LIMMALPVSTLIAGPIGGRLADRYDPRVVAAAGMFVTFLAVLGMSFLFFLAGMELDLGRVRGRPLRLAATGMGVSLVLVPAQTMSQQETPPEMVGRVSSTFMSLISVAQMLGLLVSGSLANRLGIRPMFLSCAVLLAVFAVGGWLWLRRRRTTPKP